MSPLARISLVVLGLCCANGALAEAPRLVVFRAGGEGLPGSFAAEVEATVRQRLDADGRVRAVSAEETRDGIATGREVGVACGAADIECYRKLAVLVEAQQLLLLRLSPRQGGVIVELTRADVASGDELRRVSRRLLVDAPVDALLTRAVEDALADAPPPERVAVLPFDDAGTGLLGPVEDAARAALTRRGGVVLVEEPAVAAALVHSDTCKSLEPRCVAAIGARLGADRVLYGALREGDGRPTAGLHLLDVVTLTQRSTIADVDGLRDDVPAALAQLFDDSAGAAALAAPTTAADGDQTGPLVMASAGGALLVVGGASAATGLLLGGAGPARSSGAPDGARAAVALAVPAVAVGSGLLAGSLLWLGTTLTQE